MKAPEAEDMDRAGLLDLAQECADYIAARNPYLELIAVSGSLSRPEHEGGHEDIDFFVISRGERLWEAFLGCLLHGWRFARSRGYDRTFFCFNYLISKDHPEEIDLRRDEYAREFLNLRVFYGLDHYRYLLEHHWGRLEEAEPALFAETLQRVDDALASRGSSSRRATSRVVDLAYRAGAKPFYLLAKLMEIRRRRRFTDGYVYSNRRVIRSHLRRGWRRLANLGADAPVARAFDNIAPIYDDVVSTPANQHMRGIVWEELSKLVRPGMRVLDLGAGNGVDAVWLANRGASVVAIDVSPGMVAAARARVADAGLGDRVEYHELAIEDLASLLPREEHAFDLVLCDFGALNVAENREEWAPLFSRLLKPDGHLVASVMNRWCLPELLGSLARLRPGSALRRVRGHPIDVGGIALDTRLYSPAEFAAGLRPSFSVVRSRALCALAVPPVMEGSLHRLATNRALRWADRVLGRLPGLRALGDHFLVVMKRDRSAYPLLSGRPPITASPLVEEGADGQTRVIVASDRLDVLNRDGSSAPGWPRRLPKPVASTPLITGAGDEARIVVGSDDHRLHAFYLDGRNVPGFPLQTGGDVFSSPLSWDLDGDGADELAFGSDDGNIYFVDGEGRAKPGWPVHSDGYVSASLAVAATPGGHALFVGSWDGYLYGVDAQGRALPGWPRRLGFPIWSTAAIADIDGDGAAEVVIAAHRLFVMRGDGEALQGFPAPLKGYCVGSPAVGDIDGDGRDEIVVASDRLYAFRYDGSELDGFPMDLGAYVWASPLLVDVNGDGKPEVVVADMDGYIWVVEGNGKLVDGSPSKAGSRIVAAPTASDVDGDGYLDLVIATWDGKVVVQRTRARAEDVTASPWRSFPRRVAAPEPILVGDAALIAPDPEPETEAQATRSAPSSTRVSLRPERPMPYRITEIHLDFDDSDFEAGLIYYEFGGRYHPTPLLRRGNRAFAIGQPLPPLKRVRFHIELQSASGERSRLPAEGDYEMMIGRRGVRQAER